jgi:AraC-like DNA-binding protein
MSVVDTFPSEVREFLRKDPNPKRAALEFDINVATVYRHAKGMDLKLIRRSKKIGLEVSDIIKVLEDDAEYNRADIARALGVSKSYVSEVLNAN